MEAFPRVFPRFLAIRFDWTKAGKALAELKLVPSFVPSSHSTISPVVSLFKPAEGRAG